ncbi:serine protease grass-like [Drosophila kikkawai]|uniref:Serine protease grass-like n=1 Tax=Drosophila kikkawai TaxID=30033 RepID=A0ABM4GD23_DROKI
MQVFLWTTLISVLLIQRSAGRMLVDQCGTSGIRSWLHYGADAESEAAPWMAAIFNNESFLCGGTVIHRRFVLTAAHCIEDQSHLFVKLGAYNKSNPTQEYNAIKGVIYRGYSKRNMEHDIGLLKLSQDIQFGIDVYPICISLDPEMKSRVEIIQKFDAYDWGSTEMERESQLLRKVRLYRLDHTTCDNFLRRPLTSNQLCIGSLDRDTCGGDSGGPLTKKVTVKGEQVQVQLGIHIFGKMRCDGERIYTDVSSYANWIERNVKSASLNSP